MSGRFVYDMRRHFGLFYKSNPLRSYPELRAVCRVKPRREPVDVLLLRENLLGLYQGTSVETETDAGREVRHTHLHQERHVRAVMKVAVNAARARRNAVAVIGKAGGMPTVHGLWRACALAAADATGVGVTMLDVDHAAYKLLQEPESFDVVVAPNCFGDILADLGGVLAGSRGLTFGPSYAADGAAVYQTNHGAAHYLVGTSTANPAAQIFSAAMMLRESFGLHEEARLVEDAVRDAWRSGWRTADVAEAGGRSVGTRHFTEYVTSQIRGAKTWDRDTRSSVG